MLLPLLLTVCLAEPPAAKEKLAAFNDLIGSWRVTGTPAQKQDGSFWTEKVAWEWQFKGADAWLKFAATTPKYHASGELRYLPTDDQYELKLTPPTGAAVAYRGKLDGKKLVLEREAERLTLTLLHHNRYLLRLDTKEANAKEFAKRWQVGATKEGEAFASNGSGGPECIVSGGLGTMRVSYKGTTYYVCCTGCRDAFLEEPEKYIAEAKAKKKP